MTTSAPQLQRQAARRSEAPGNPWVAHGTGRDDAAVRLFCLPFAGGGASVFRTWGELLPDSIDVCPVQFPGREGRAREPYHEDLHELAEALAAGIEPLLDRPYAIYGHSLGGLVGYELAAELERFGQGPTHLFVGASPAPHLGLRRAPVYHLPDPDLIAWLGALDGTPKQVLEHPWLLKLYLPTLRADLKVFETYLYGRHPALTCPITALAGDADAHVGRADLCAWDEHTIGGFEVVDLPGAHFFLRDQAAAVTATIAGALAE